MTDMRMGPFALASDGASQLSSSVDGRVVAVSAPASPGASTATTSSWGRVRPVFTS
jgi:hypothetical protein